MKNARLWAALAEVQDPEMPVNLVDLGVIYAVNERDGVVDVDLTFTAMGCPASDFILDDVRERLLREDGVREVRINVVWSPPWTASRMTQAGRDALEAWGRVSGDAVEYAVFARKTRVEPLRQVGSVVAPDDDLAAAYARATYDEERWIEMAIVRRDHVIALWTPGES